MKFSRNFSSSQASCKRWTKLIDVVEAIPKTAHIQSTVQVVDGTKATVFTASYYPYGRIAAISGNESLKFTEMPYDSLTGLYFFGTRFYDPTIGRFVQRDTFAGVLSNPLSLNKYAYAEDNPVTLSDSTGHDWWNPFTWSANDQATPALIVISAALIIGSLGLDAPAVLSADAGLPGNAQSRFEQPTPTDQFQRALIPHLYHPTISLFPSAHGKLGRT